MYTFLRVFTKKPTKLGSVGLVKSPSTHTFPLLKK
jgi:hypothetical protein